MAIGQNPDSLNTLPKLFRTGGSGFTAFTWMGHVIGFAETVGHTSPTPVAQPKAIQPLDQQYPMQIIVPAAVGPGTLQVQLFEMYNKKIWDQIMLITDTKDPGREGVPSKGIYNDLSEIFLRLSALSKGVVCAKLVYPPNTGVRGSPTSSGFSSLNQTNTHYADVFHNCIITDIRDDETIRIETMEVVKNLTIQYTYSTRVSGATAPFFS